ncbi:MAG: hypothetical protein GX036_07885 [Firmicutes bacterium]|nr:hypothetical protein [Bacillota bacterium]
MALCRIAGRRGVISCAWRRCSVRAVLEAGGGSKKPEPRNPAGLLRLGGKENRVRGLRDLHVPEATTPPPAACPVFPSPLAKHTQGRLPRPRFPGAPARRENFSGDCGLACRQSGKGTPPARWGWAPGPGLVVMLKYRGTGGKP